MEKYRIVDVRDVRVNGKDKIIFRVFELRKDCYIFAGQYLAPIGTAKKDLVNYIK